ncbi:MAG: hypothetical protein J6C91_05820 [Muribaculaceae bacterium]|nr:hypothetical protein [Muribaculaceae bacterium]
MNKLIIPLLLLAVFGLTACSDDPDDSCKEVMIHVTNETYFKFLPSDGDIPKIAECMIAESEEFPGAIVHIGFDEIKGFNYEFEHEYDLLVRSKTIPGEHAYSHERKYTLVRILDDKPMEDPEVPVDENIKTESDIEYYDKCPIEKYSTHKDFHVMYHDGVVGSRLSIRYVPKYDHAQIWLGENLEKNDPDWAKFHAEPYQACYTYVVSPFSDKIRLVRNKANGPMFRFVVPEDEYARIKSMKPDEKVTYTLILANLHKKALQKLEINVINN